jgi:hypothetical protein
MEYGLVTSGKKSFILPRFWLAFATVAFPAETASSPAAPSFAAVRG